MVAAADFMLAIGDEVARAWRYDRVLSVGVGMIGPMDRPPGADFGAAEIQDAVVECLRAGLRVPDRIASFGTGEITILLPEANTRQAGAALNRLCAHVAAEQFELNGVAFTVSVSLGAAGLTHRIRTAQRLLVAARQQWRAAAAAGGNRCVAAVPDRVASRQIRSAELH